MVIASIKKEHQYLPEHTTVLSMVCDTGKQNDNKWSVLVDL
jgi:hypothetical protein